MQARAEVQPVRKVGSRLQSANVELVDRRASSAGSRRSRSLPTADSASKIARSSDPCV